MSLCESFNIANSLDFDDTETKEDSDAMDNTSNSTMKFSWNIDESLLSDFKKTMECESGDITVDGFEDYVWIWTLTKDENSSTVNLQLALKSLPTQIGSLKINYTITSDEKFSYYHKHNGIRLTMKDALHDQLAAAEQIKKNQEKINTHIIDSFDFNKFTDEKMHSLHFKCNIEILIKYDLFGGIISATDKPLYVSKSKLNNTIVYGYINNIYNFDSKQMELFPLSIYDLIYAFYLMFLNVQQKQAQFTWKFDNKSDINLFMNCGKDDSITTRRFELHGCVFYLELTPNGWGVWTKGDCLLWLAVHSLPEKVKTVNVFFRVDCEAINFSSEREETLTDAINIGDYGFSVSQKEGSQMKMDQFIGLNSFEFKITIKVLKMLDQSESKDHYNAFVSSKYDFLKKLLSSMHNKENSIESTDTSSTHPNKPIYISPSKLNNIIVYGYMHNIQQFNSTQIESIPSLIYDLIYEYYLMLLNIKEEQCEFIWKFNNKSEIDLFMNCTKDDIISTRKFELNNCVFYFELTPNGWGSNWDEGYCNVWLAVDTLPQNVKKLMILFRVSCDSIGFSQEVTKTLTQAKDSGLYAYSCTQDKPNHMRLEQFRELEQFEFKIFVKVMETWTQNLHPPIEEIIANKIPEKLEMYTPLSAGKPIYVSPSKLNKSIVYGYINKITSMPLTIYELIYEYYLMILNITESQAEFLWKFNNNSEIDLFMNCAKDDIITTRQFEINGCVFYCELTPNGWGRWSKGDCLIWLAVHSLPPNVSKVKIFFRVICDAIGYNKEKIQILYNPSDGAYSTTPEADEDEAVKLNVYRELNEFEFQIFVKVTKLDKSE